MTDDELVERLTLPKCPHGNNGHMIHDPTPHGNVTISTAECLCSVTVDWDYVTHSIIEQRAVAAWTALCATAARGEKLVNRFFPCDGAGCGKHFHKPTCPARHRGKARRLLEAT